MFGATGVGKTTRLLNFPSVFYTDTEKGGIYDQYLDALKAGGGRYHHTTSLDGLIETARSLIRGGHPYKTWGIDPITGPWLKEVDAAAEELKSPRNPTGTEHGAHIGRARKKLRRLIELCTAMDLNIVITCHAKTLWKGSEAAGLTYDADEKLGYWLDLMLCVDLAGKARVATVTKTRIRAFPMGGSLPFTYRELSRRFGGQAVIGREVKGIELADAAEVDRLLALLPTVPLKKGQTPDGMMGAWLERARVSTPYDLPAASVAASIEWCGRRLAQKE